MPLSASTVRFRPSSLLLAVVCVAAALPLACDDGPGVATDQRAPNDMAGRAGVGGGTSGNGGKSAIGGNAQAGGNTQAGGSAQAGGAAQTGGSNQAGGSAQAGGAAGGSDDSCLGVPNPAGCFSRGCALGEMCVQRADVCVPSGCTCANTGWSCTPDCGGGSCVQNGPKYFARLGFISGQQLFRDWCVAYSVGADGVPAFEPLGVLLSHFTDPKSFDGLEKLTRYIELEKQPLAWGFTSTGTCGNEASYGTAARADDYQTVLAMPESGEALRMWTLPDSGPSEGSFVGPAARVVNALAASEPVTVTLVGTNAIALGSLGFANVPGYTTVDGGALQRVEITRQNGAKAVVDFVPFDLLSVERTTIVLRGFAGSESALVCNDAKPGAGAFGEPPPDVFSSGCTVVKLSP